MQDLSRFDAYADIVSRVETRPQGRQLIYRCLWPARHRRGDRHWSSWFGIGRRGQLISACVCGVTARDIAPALGFRLRDFFPDRWRHMDDGTKKPEWPKPVPVAEYPYHTAGGQLVAVKVRFEPGYCGRAKTFAWKRPLPQQFHRQAGVKGGAVPWVWGLDAGQYGRPTRAGKTGDFRPLDDTKHQEWFDLPQLALPGLWRLPDLLAAPTRAVLVAEGEKAAAYLQSFAGRDLPVEATCGAFGSTVWDWDWVRPLSGRRVVVLPDADDKGVYHAGVVAGTLLRAGVASARVVWPGDRGYDPAAGEGPDDWLARQADPKAALIDLVRRFPEWKPDGGISPARARPDPEPEPVEEYATDAEY